MFPKLQAFFKRANDFLIAVAKALPFKKRGGSYMAIAVVMFVIVLTVYILSGVFQGLEAPLQTVTAAQYESSTAYYSKGYIVRKETVLTSDAPLTSLVLSEGQKTSTGEPVARGYTSADARQRQQEISQLENELTQLYYALGTSSTAVNDQATMDAQIRDQLMSTTVLLSKDRFADVKDAAPEIKGLILRSTSSEKDLEQIRSQITSLENRLSELRTTISGSISSIPAPCAGYFSGTVDGYESILTPDALSSLTVSQFHKLSPKDTPNSAIGRIITGDVWYYVTVIPSSEIQNLPIGSTVSVSFSQDVIETIPMTISHIGQEENGKVVLTLKSDHYLQDMTMVRQQNADIIFQSHTGLRVPKEAIHVLDNGTVGVYVLESVTVNWKRVEILHDNGESYIVKLDKSSTNNLWPGDEIIVSGEEDLYEGKVIS